MGRKHVGMVALAAALTVGGAGLAIAQPATAPEAGDTATEADDGFDWGWLGLLGLAGLAGLRGRKEPVRTTTTGTVR